MALQDYQWGLEQLRVGDLSAAEATFGQLICTYPAFAEAYEQRAHVRLRRSEVAGAIADYKEAARLFVERRDKPSAQRCIDQLQRLLTPLVAGAGPVGEGHSGVDLGLTPNLNSGLKSGGNPLLLEQEFLVKVRRKLDAGDRVGALADLNWLLQCEPGAVDVLCLRGLVLAQLGRGEEAVQDFTLALQLAPERTETLQERAIARLAWGDARGAIADFNQLLSKTNTPVEVLLHRGRAYVQIQEWDRAFKDFSNALGMSPNRVDLCRLRAEVCRQLGDVKGAIADYQEMARLALEQGDWSAHQRALQVIAGLDQQDQVERERRSKVLRLPILHWVRGLPVVEVVVNGRWVVEMAVDMQVGRSLLTQSAASELVLPIVGWMWGRLPDGSSTQLEVGQLQSLALQSWQVQDLPVAIAEFVSESVLGRDVLDSFKVKILTDAVELEPS